MIKTVFLFALVAACCKFRFAEEELPTMLPWFLSEWLSFSPVFIFLRKILNYLSEASTEDFLCNVDCCVFHVTFSTISALQRTPKRQINSHCMRRVRTISWVILIVLAQLKSTPRHSFFCLSNQNITSARSFQSEVPYIDKSFILRTFFSM